MLTDWSSLYKDFLKSELVAIAEELGIPPIGETTSKVLVKNIMQNLQDEGIPEAGQSSVLLLEYLVAAEICDEDGNLLDSDPVEGSAELQKDELPVPVEQLPQCYGFEDDRDPACRKCRVMQQCKIKRIESRPPCYGKLFMEHDESCKVCIEALYCKQELEKIKQPLLSKKGK